MILSKSGAHCQSKMKSNQGSNPEFESDVDE